MLPLVSYMSIFPLSYEYSLFRFLNNKIYYTFVSKSNFMKNDYGKNKINACYCR